MTRHGRRNKQELSEANSLLAKALGRREIFERLEARQVAKRWEEAVGSQLASKSSPEKFEHGVLTVAVSSAPWAQELRLRKKELLARLNETAGRELFQDLKFSVRQPDKKPTETVSPGTFEPETLDIEVSVPEIAEVVKRALGRHRAASKRKS
jgi:predicted nucleic acid-binding Zn ribbon protein